MSAASAQLDAPAERPLVSGTSILLFSAFLAGMVFGHAIPPVTRMHAVTAAAAGTIAYIGLWYTHRVQEHLQTMQASRKVTRKLERKLGKHLTGVSAAVSRRVDHGRAE